MLRRVAIVSLLFIVVACGGGVWLVHGQMTAQFLAPGAADIQVAELALGKRQITYRMPNPDDGWQTAVARRLSLSGWRLADRDPWGGTDEITVLATFVRTSQFWFLELHERAELLGDRTFALIKVSYSVDRRR
jgi:hypothetical protein